MITSIQNPKIKNIAKLVKKSSERAKQNLIAVEGDLEIKRALDAGFGLVEIFTCPEIDFDFDLVSKDKIVQSDLEVLAKISYRDKPDSPIALFRPRYFSLVDIDLDKNFLVPILEAIEKPGNLGAILRTVDGVGLDCLIVNDLVGDIYNPNAIRASRGAIFRVKVVSAEFAEIKNFLQKNKIKIIATSLEAEKNYTKVNFKTKKALVFGSEDKGLSKKWPDLADDLIKIPMLGTGDSLNVSVSVGVVVYEALRQCQERS